ncbi:putative mitochondrial chaperone BCS1-B [Echria macrotheca]|uniref:Mitochondrial chaperone BCS1-B n=1 Tax=Echria macrotheca TaxID=438768 RepID=A0AAJ0BJP3_9PEZI|nr:putative mitochondrial chaperone BCS1-B [Echria macrotheca]
MAATAASETAVTPQTVLLDLFFPGFSVFSTAIQKYLHIDLNLYIPLVLLCGGLTVAWQYFSEYAWNQIEAYLMSVVDIRTDDEIYTMLMSWVASQRFAQGARRFVVNTNLSSRSWWVYRWSDDDDDDDDEGGEHDYSGRRKKKALAYTPTFGSHYFWYRGRLLIFRRTQNQAQSGYLLASEKEEISISCFGRNPWILKELLHEARTAYIKRDQAKTLIYRGTCKSGSTEPTWQRCMARTSRPFSTVIINEKVKQELIDDVSDYLDPATRRWYSNRGIPYRRGYLLHGPPGTGKSSLSLALAGFFKMRIYIVSLSSVTASEENLASLFAELPRRCVVLLEDIDTAGLTHTRDDAEASAPAAAPKAPAKDDMVPGQITPGEGNQPSGRLSLSGLLNILDGVASQEGRVLIMTTNHIEKLDKALIRPGRVDMIVKFDKADAEMTAAIFRAIFAPLEGDDAPITKREGEKYADLAEITEAERVRREEWNRKQEETLKRVNGLAEKFAARIPAHEFSPAEIQGFLLKNKRNPDAAVESAEKWVETARKEKQEKEKKEAEEKRKKDEEEKKKKEEEERKKKEEEDKEKKEKEEKEKKKSSKRKSSKKSRRKSSKKDESDSSSSSGSGSESESEAEASGAEKKKRSKSKSDKGSVDAKAEVKPAVVVVEPPASLKTETSNKTVVAEDDKGAQLDVREEGRQQATTGADSGYGTP